MAVFPNPHLCGCRSTARAIAPAGCHTAAVGLLFASHPEPDALPRVAPTADSETSSAPSEPEPATAEVRAWAIDQDLPVSDRGRLRPEVWYAWRDEHQ
ncbi:MAG: hypothetical protein GEU97_21870 [Actinophytocola sp.]|nr:hypothetical protein [Actinophytocola sp.]